MNPPLRIETVNLPAEDPKAVARFYRWTLGLRPAPEAASEGVTSLAWGKEDCVRIVATGAGAVGLRMPSATLDAIASWCAGYGTVPRQAAVPHDDDAERAAEHWPDAEVRTTDDEAAANRITVTLPGPAGLDLDLGFPLPKEILIERGDTGPYYRRGADWSGLELPGLLGVTTTTIDLGATRARLGALGLGALDAAAPDGPFGVGEHQWIVNPGEFDALTGFAVVMRAPRIRDVERSLQKLEADYRIDDHRLLTVDPEGRMLLVHGVRGA